MALLKRHAGVNDGDFSMNDVAKEVASECKGLPLAIVAVGSALKGKGINEWKAVSRKLKNSKLFDVEDVDADVYACLKLSYDYLKSENTKFVFLLCSLFAEDFKIDKEDLLRYGIGIGLFDDADTIEDARNELHLLVTNLKDCCLLLDAGEQFVKMHDIVRDVALWIGSEGKNVLMGKAGNGLTEWPKKYGLDRHTAISLMDNNIKVLPTGLECPKLEILLLGGYNHCNVVVPDQFFTQMKALKILTIIKGELSLESLELLENIRTLQLIKCTLRDMSSLRKLKRLGILNLRFSYFVCEISEGLGDLDELRLLDLRETRHPLSVMRRFPPLEEFYGDIKFKDVQIEPTSSEINSEPCFDFSKLRRYKINLNVDFPRYLPGTTALEMKDIEATTLVLFKALYRSLQYFALTNAMGCQNIVPSIDQEGFNELNDLVLRNCKELECIVDTSQQQVPPIAFSNLTKLCLIDLNCLTEICYGANYPRKFLENLEILYVSTCHSMHSLLSAKLLRQLQKLKEVEVNFCNKLQEVFRCHNEKESDPVLLIYLAKLNLVD